MTSVPCVVTIVMYIKTHRTYSTVYIMYGVLSLRCALHALGTLIENAISPPTTTLSNVCATQMWLHADHAYNHARNAWSHQSNAVQPSDTHEPAKIQPSSHRPLRLRGAQDMVSLQARGKEGSDARVSPAWGRILSACAVWPLLWHVRAVCSPCLAVAPAVTFAGSNVMVQR